MGRFLAVDPGERMRIVLARYANAADPPVITAKYMTARERRAFVRCLDEVTGANDEADIAKLTQAFSLAAVRFGEDPAERWADLLTDAEASELIGRILTENRLTEEQRKNFESPSQSDTTSPAQQGAKAGVESNSHAESAAAT